MNLYIAVGADVVNKCLDVIGCSTSMANAKAAGDRRKKPGHSVRVFNVGERNFAGDIVTWVIELGEEPEAAKGAVIGMLKALMSFKEYMKHIN